MLISASDDAAEAVNQHKDGTATATLNPTPCSAPLSGCTNQSLDLELLNHASSSTFAALAPHLTKLPLLIVSCNDPYAPEHDALEKALISQGAAPPVRVHLNTGHAYSDQRPALTAAIIGWLQKLRSPGVK